MNLLKRLLLGVAVLIALVIGAGLLLPRTAHVERAVTIDAPAATVFTVLNGFRQFAQWSPWAEYDPQMTVTFDGPPAGAGARYSWTGNDQVGSGSQEIVESEPHELIRIKLVFGDFPGDYIATYRLAAEGDGTRVTWSFDADYGNSISGRYFGLLSEMLIGPDYEKGLAKLKTFVETLPAGDFSSMSFEMTETVPAAVALLPAKAARETKAIGVALGVAYSRLSGFMATHGLKRTAPPLAIFHGEEGGVLSFDAGIPVDRTDVPAEGEVRTGRTYAGSALRATYQGPYSGLLAANARVRAYMAAAGLEQAGPYWEQYMSDPGQTPEAELITHIYYPVK